MQKEVTAVPDLAYYEKKVLSDRVFPVQLAVNTNAECREIFASHWHEHIEMHYVTSGGAVFHIDQQLYHLQAGDLIIANSGEIHAGYSTQVPYEAWLLVFEPEAVAPGLLERNARFCSLIRGDETVHQLIARMMEETGRQAEGYGYLCRALVTELLVYLNRNYRTETLSDRSVIQRRRNLERLAPALQYIEQHYTDRITVPQLARMLCLSTDRLGHLFREGVGQAPLQYINEIRLRKAMNLLNTGEYTVTEVAQAVGFYDYNHFGRLFRRRYGATPNQVRRGNAIPKKE